MDYIFELDADEVVYEIDVFDNLDRPKKDRMKAIIMPLSAKDASLLSREAREQAESEGVTREDSNWQTVYIEAYEQVSFSKRVLRLENISVRGADGTVREITDPAELYSMKDRRMALIATDIRVGMQATGELPEVVEKNSE